MACIALSDQGFGCPLTELFNSLLNTSTEVENPDATVCMRKPICVNVLCQWQLI